jgi:hypothetical protein
MGNSVEPELPQIKIPVIGPIMTVADHLARRNDRWMAIFLLVVLLSFCGWVINEMGKQLSESRTALTASQNQVIDYYKNANSANLEQRHETASVLEKLNGSVNDLKASIDRLTPYAAERANGAAAGSR